MQPSQPVILAPGKCEQCRKVLGAHPFALWYDHAKVKRSCPHIVCGTCRGMMQAWRRQCCPNSNCGKPFYAIQDALSPSTASLQDFFKFVNHTQTGRVTKEELADWYTTIFDMSRADALNMIGSNWQFWDVPKNHSFFKLGFLRPKDQGDLDMEEFPAVQDFMTESLLKSLNPMAVASTSTAPNASSTAEGLMQQPRHQLHAKAQQQYLVDNRELQASTRGLSYRSAMRFDARLDPEDVVPWNSYVSGFDVDGEWIKVPAKNAFLPVFAKCSRSGMNIRVLTKSDEATSPVPRGVKRPNPGGDSLADGVLRHVSQRTSTKAEELQGKLCNNADKGSEWFKQVDADGSGKLEKPELINGLLETFNGSHRINRDQITSIVEGVWDAMDTDGSASIDFDEFQLLREAMVAQLSRERMDKAVSHIIESA